MAGLMNKNAGKEKKRKQGHGQLRMTRDQQEYGLDLTMQKPLEQYQRHKHQYKPEEA
jgi:hypothetical protein